MLCSTPAIPAGAFGLDVCMGRQIDSIAASEVVSARKGGSSCNVQSRLGGQREPIRRSRLEHHSSGGPTRSPRPFVGPMINEPMDDVVYIPNVPVSEDALSIGLILPQVILPLIELRNLLPAPLARIPHRFVEQMSQGMSAQAGLISSNFRNRLRVPVLHNGFLDAGQQVPETMVNFGPNRRRQRWFAPRCIGEMTIEGQQTVIGGRAAHEA